jgi:uridylate kinase
MKMKKVLKAFVVMFLMATVLNASSLKESLNVDGYNLELTSKRDLSAGSNEFYTKLQVHQRTRGQNDA